MNICVHVFDENMFSILIKQEWNSRVTWVWGFWGAAKVFFAKQLHQFIFLSAVYVGTSLSISSPIFIFYSFHISVGEWCLIVVLIHIFPVVIDADPLFICLLTICLSLQKYWNPSPTFNWVVNTWSSKHYDLVNKYKYFLEEYAFILALKGSSSKVSWSMNKLR
jgi:hypothetical protein